MTMIQRIQSLYLLVAITLLAITSRVPLMAFLTIDGEYYLVASGITQGDKSILTTIPLLVLLITSLALNAFAFISFKKRMLQIRLLVFSIILQMGCYGMGIYYLIRIKEIITAPIALLFPTVFPVVAAIFTFFAFKNIAKDEALVKSLERLR